MSVLSMVVGELPAELLMKPVRVERHLGTGQVLVFRRMRFVVSNGHVLLYQDDGWLVVDAKIVASQYVEGSSSFQLDTDNGEHWYVEKMSCNCGG